MASQAHPKHCFCSPSGGPAAALIGDYDSSQNGAGMDASMAKSQSRIRRLEVLAALRKLYRNLLRAEGLLAQPEPIYQHQTGGLCGQGRKGVAVLGLLLCWTFEQQV